MRFVWLLLLWCVCVCMARLNIVVYSIADQYQIYNPKDYTFKLLFQKKKKRRNISCFFFLECMTTIRVVGEKKGGIGVGDIYSIVFLSFLAKVKKKRTFLKSRYMRR